VLPPRVMLSRACAEPGGSNCQWEVAGIAGTSTPSPATSDWQLVGTARLPGALLQQRPKAGGFRPQPSVLAAACSGDAMPLLLQLDGGASRLEVLLELLGVFLRHAFLDVLRRTLDQVLGLLQAQAGDGADGLDDLDLLVASGLQDDGELGLLLGGRTGGNRASGHGDRGGGGDAELLFDGLDQLHHFHQRLGGDGVDDLLVGKGHCVYLWILSGMVGLRCGRSPDQAVAASAGAASPPCLSATALTARANIAAGSARTRASMARACSRVGSDARTSTWLAGYSWPPRATTFGCSLSLALANSLIRRPAAPGSSSENAYSSGPTSASFAHS